MFDEVITGFRLGSGGAQQHYGVTPDLTCFGKVIGGGLPVGAFGGRADVMDVLAPLGPVYQAGTLSGNPLATAAGLAVLDELDDGVYMMMEGRAAQLAGWLRDVISEAGLPISVPVVGPLHRPPLLVRAGDRLRHREADRREVLRGVLPRDARPWGGVCARPIRGRVPEHRSFEGRARARRRSRERGRARGGRRGLISH